MAQFEDLEIESTASVSFVCEDCGRVHARNNPPCNDCGSMNLSATEETADPTEIDETESRQLVRDAQGLTGTAVFVYFVGGLTLLAGLWMLGVWGGLRGVLTTGGWVIGSGFTLAGLLAMPLTRWQFEKRLDIYLSPRIVLGLYLALVFGGFVPAFFV